MHQFLINQFGARQILHGLLLFLGLNPSSLANTVTRCHHLDHHFSWDMSSRVYQLLFQDFYILFLELEREGLSDSQFADYWRSVEAHFQRCSSSVASSGFSSAPLVVPLVVGSVQLHWWCHWLWVQFSSTGGAIGCGFGSAPLVVPLVVGSVQLHWWCHWSWVWFSSIGGAIGRGFGSAPLVVPLVVGLVQLHWWCHWSWVQFRRVLKVVQGQNEGCLQLPSCSRL